MMTKLASHRLMFAALVPLALAAAGVTRANAQPAPSSSVQDPYDDQDDADADDQDAPATPDDIAPQPATPQPQTAPPAPPASPPAAAPQGAPQVQAQAAPPSSNGQWIYTQQYGWIYSPYGDQYVYTPEETTGAVYPSAYVYAPTYGWTWLAAPWVWGWGPRVYFGIGGPRYYHWYGHGFYHRGGRYYARGPIYRGGYRGVIRGGYVGHHGYVGGGHYYGGGHYGGGHFGGHFGGGHGGGHFSGHVGGGRHR